MLNIREHELKTPEETRRQGPEEQGTTTEEGASSQGSAPELALLLGARARGLYPHGQRLNGHSRRLISHAELFKLF